MSTTINVTFNITNPRRLPNYHSHFGCFLNMILTLKYFRTVRFSTLLAITPLERFPPKVILATMCFLVEVTIVGSPNLCVPYPPNGPNDMYDSGKANFLNLSATTHVKILQEENI